MARRIGFIAAWVAATFATGLVAWGAVRIAGSQVSDSAVRPLSAAEVAALPTVPTPADGATAETQPTEPPAAAPTPAGDEVVGPTVTSSVTSTAVPGVTPGAPTGAPAQTTTTGATTTTAPSSAPGTTAPATEVKTYTTGGGSVTIVVSPGVVELGGASPASGYSVEVDKDGPNEVKVKFETRGEEDGEDYEFSAEWEGGRLVVEFD